MHSRTDLHTEPIGNIAVQLHGTREWTLVPTKWSGLLRPTVSKHGRDPLTELPIRLKEIPLVWKCVTNQGDALWVPPWMWHRVDYNEAKDRSDAPMHNLELWMVLMGLPRVSNIGVPVPAWKFQKHSTQHPNDRRQRP
eukprot:scaffold249318_cov54-Cyclotella_meneghiniana.AAC.1